MCSIMHKVPHRNIDKVTNQEMIAFGNTFEEIGYGFIAIKNKRSNIRDLLLECDPAYYFY